MKLANPPSDCNKTVHLPRWSTMHKWTLVVGNSSTAAAKLGIQAFDTKLWPSAKICQGWSLRFCRTDGKIKDGCLLHCYHVTVGIVECSIALVLSTYLLQLCRAVTKLLSLDVLQLLSPRQLRARSSFQKALVPDTGWPFLPTTSNF